MNLKTQAKAITITGKQKGKIWLLSAASEQISGIIYVSGFLWKIHSIIATPNTFKAEKFKYFLEQLAIQQHLNMQLNVIM